MSRTWLTGIVLAGLLTGLVGCASGPSMGRYDVVVTMDPELANRAGGAPQVMVDLVGVNDTEFQQWSGKSMTEYWSPNGAMRSESKTYRYEIPFGPGNAEPKTLSRKDKVWQAWKDRGALHLFVLADLPGAHGDKPGTEDGRRVILPLDKARWTKTDTIQIFVQRTRVTCTTPPDPPKP
jgi:hypothetical protein